MSWTILAGGLLLALLAVDAFLTVLHASTGGGPYTSLQNRVIWRLGTLLDGALAGRGTALSFAAPVMALATPVAWVTMLTAGFALLYLADLAAFSSQPPFTGPPWVEALYYSGYVTTTLGLGDVTPRSPGWRLAAIVHSGLGFALFSAAITYILTVYRRYTDGASLALHLHEALGPEFGVTWGEPGSGERRFAQRLALEATSALCGANVAHEQYPILHYFHPRPERSIVVQVGRLVDLVDAAPEEERRPAGALSRSIETFLEQMPFATEGEPDETGASLRERHRRLLRAHRYPAD